MQLSKFVSMTNCLLRTFLVGIFICIFFIRVFTSLKHTFNNTCPINLNALTHWRLSTFWPPFFLARKVCLKKKSNLLQTNEKMKYPTLSIAIMCSQSKAVDIGKVKSCQHIRLLNDCLQNIHLRVFFFYSSVYQWTCNPRKIQDVAVTFIIIVDSSPIFT